MERFLNRSNNVTFYKAIAQIVAGILGSDVLGKGVQYC